METEKADAREQIIGRMEAHHTIGEQVRADGIFTIECYAADGGLIWREETTRAVDKRTDEDEARR
jgi:hypothetical protein